MCNTVFDTQRFKLFTVKRQRQDDLFGSLHSVHPIQPSNENQRKKKVLFSTSITIPSSTAEEITFPPLTCSDNYDLVCKTLSTNLAVAVNMNSDFISDQTQDTWQPPDNYGLQNSPRIFGDYYLTGKQLHGKLFLLDFYSTIEDDIRNLRKLSYYQLRYIRDLDSDEKQNLIELFNNTMSTYAENYL